MKRSRPSNTRAAGADDPWRLNELVRRRRLREQGRRARVTTELRLRELLDRLAAAEVRFVMVGGLAVNAWGHARGTQDVDLVPEPDRGNLDRLAIVLEEAGGRVETAQGRLAPNAIRTFLAAGDRTLVATDLGPVDVLQGLPQIQPFSRLDAEAVAVDLGGRLLLVRGESLRGFRKEASESSPWTSTSDSPRASREGRTASRRVRVGNGRLGRGCLSFRDDVKGVVEEADVRGPSLERDRPDVGLLELCGAEAVLARARGTPPSSVTGGPVG